MASTGDDYKHRLGNLLLLEGSINSACQNKTVENKVSSPSLYLSSGIKTVKALAATRSGASQGAIARRTLKSVAKVLHNYCWTAGQSPMNRR
ncbi:GmrSD restriction endonuclease domain-containing protein [Burkholderia pseudomallei]|uniref:GmrSD restriction endonuclease domain-containing protein n=1 Tax=Burkholderia pseudomallei TaxID=28450 RepID=UPI000537092C|nr:hypothetical protein Y043_2837 [Burkholderia pseudomallei MSHR2138]KGX47846.1 hypothetical protein Y600_5987 [Burkholderia pseudomallei MSHR3709]